MNNSNKLIATVLISVLAQLAAPVQAMIADSESIEVQDALSQCHNALRARYQNPGDHRIYQRPGTSIKTGQVTFWINSMTQQNGVKVALKSRCVSDYQGSEVTLKVASGQWR